MFKNMTWRRDYDFILIHYVDQLAFVGGEGNDAEIKAALDSWSESDDNIYIITKKQAESLEQLLTSKGFVVKS